MKRAIQTAMAVSLLIGSSIAAAHEAGTWVLRAGAGHVAPKSNNLDLGSLELGGGLAIDSAYVEVDYDWSLVLSATYMMSGNWAIDILAAAPFKHDINVPAVITDNDETTAIRIPLGETSHLPPTVSLQYHFSPESQVQPYIGLGLNWTVFFDESLTSTAQGAGFQDLSLDDSFGLAAQLGMDLSFDDNWLINFDIRWLNIETDATVTLDVGDGPATGKLGTVEIDPWVYQVNIGYRF